MPGGHPLTLNDAAQTAIVQAIRFGTPIHRAASFAGIPESSIREWRRRARAALNKPAGKRSPTERRLVEFSSAVDKAIAEAVMSMQQIVFEVAHGGVIIRNDEGNVMAVPTTEDKRLALQAATWYLSHREQRDYSTRLEHTGAEGGPVEVREVTLADLQAKLHNVGPTDPDDEIEGDEDDG